MELEFPTILPMIFIIKFIEKLKIIIMMIIITN